MRLALAHARFESLELLRLPSFIVPTLSFPALLYLIFGLPQPDERATFVMAVFTAFAVLGVAFFQFGVGIAVERGTSWQVFLRILPVRPAARLVARAISALLFGLGSAILVVAAALTLSSAQLEPGAWACLVVVLLAGGATFALLGVAIGYWFSPKGALPVANVLYLGLSYVGGLWMPTSELPELVRAVSPYVPTSYWSELVAAATTGSLGPAESWVALLAFGVAFAGLAVWGYRRDEGQHYR
jgi:ABC-2 type transport system permease protein